MSPTLFVCPACGWEDRPCWRNHQHQLYTSYCHIEELEALDSALAAEIKNQKPSERLPMVKGPYVYVLKKSGYVWRVTVESYNSGAFRRRLTENPKHSERLRLSRSQKKIKGWRAPF